MDPKKIKFRVIEHNFPVTPVIRKITPVEWMAETSDLKISIKRLDTQTLQFSVISCVGELHRDVYYDNILVLNNVSRTNTKAYNTLKVPPIPKKVTVTTHPIEVKTGVAPESHHPIRRQIEEEKIEGKLPPGDIQPGDIRVAIFNQIYGMHPFGGPAVHGFNVVATLKKANIPFTMFHKYEGHTDYMQERYSDVVRPYSEFNPGEYNIFYVMSDSEQAKALYERGCSPIIIGSNIVPNSLPEFCMRTNPPQISSDYERKVVSSLKGVFWLAQSNYQMREYRRLGLPKSVPVYIAVNPVDTDMFVPNNTQKDIDICWSGKNTWAKGLPLLKEVVANRANNSFMLFTEDRLDTLSSYNNIRLITGKTIFKIKDYIPRAKVFLSTSYKEFQPLAMLEAMSCEVPPVAFKTSGVDEIIRDGENGISVDCYGIDHLIIALDDLLQDEDYRLKLGKNARKYVIKHHGYEACAKAYMKLFKRSLELNQK
jgi:glycosyltransferase involved in cell wall biosynthesis